MFIVLITHQHFKPLFSPTSYLSTWGQRSVNVFVIVNRLKIIILDTRLNTGAGLSLGGKLDLPRRALTRYPGKHGRFFQVAWESPAKAFSETLIKLTLLKDF